MTKLQLYDKKTKKIIRNDLIEMDLNDLEISSNFKHGKEFFKIPSEVIGNKSVIEWFVVDEISYWWLISPIIQSKFKFAVRLIDQLESIVAQHSIDSIYLNGCFENAELIRAFCNVKNINFGITPKFHFFNSKQSGKRYLKESGYKKIYQKKFKKRIECLKNKKFSKPVNGSTIITSPGIYRRYSYDFESKSRKKEEFFIQPILNFFNKENLPFMCFDLDYTFRGTTNNLKERLDSEFNWAPIEVLLQGKKEDSTIRVLSILKNQFNELKKFDLDSVFNYKNIPMWKFLEPTFMEIFYEPNLPTYIDLIHKLEKFLSDVNPKQIIQIYETGPFAKAFEIVASKLKIKTFAIQHGLIPSDYPDYIFKEIKNHNNPFGNIIPKTTFVYGDYHKKILTEDGSYPEDNIVVIGHPSYFEINRIKQSLTQEDLLKKYKLPNKKIILVPLTFNFPNYRSSPDKTFLNSIYDEFKNDEDVIVLVRPHPGDNLDQTLFEKLYSSKNFKISQGTLVEDLTISDIITALPISTTITEAVLFEKPIVLGNMGIKNPNDSFDKIYHELINFNVAILCDLKDIRKKILSIKKGELWKTEDSENREKFLKLFFNYGEKIDLHNYLN